MVISMKYFMKGFIVSTVLLSISCSLVNAESPSSVLELAKVQNISPDISVQAIQQTEAMGETVGYIRHIMKGRIAGIYIEYQPEYMVVVRLKGHQSPPEKALKLANKYPIRYETGLEYSVEELVESYDKHFEQIQTFLPSVQGIGVDEKHGQIVISILKSDEQNSEAQNQIRKILAKPVRFEVQEMATVEAN